MAGVRPDKSACVCNLCETGIFKMRNTPFFHVSVPNIYGTSSSTYDNIFEGDMKGFVLQHNSEVNKFMQLSILLIDLFVGTYRLSSHARLQAFLNYTN